MLVCCLFKDYYQHREGRDATGRLGCGQARVKNLPANAGDMGSVPGLGRSPGEENGNSL